jgi:hypothetical protein
LRHHERQLRRRLQLVGGGFFGFNVSGFVLSFDFGWVVVRGHVVSGFARRQRHGGFVVRGHVVSGFVARRHVVFGGFVFSRCVVRRHLVVSGFVIRRQWHGGQRHGRRQQRRECLG